MCLEGTLSVWEATGALSPTPDHMKWRKRVGGGMLEKARLGRDKIERGEVRQSLILTPSPLLQLRFGLALGSPKDLSFFIL